MRIIIAIAIAIAIGAFGLLIIDNNNQQGCYLKTSILKQKSGDASLIEYDTANIQQKPTHVDDDAAGSNEDEGEKPQLNSAEVEFEMTNMSMKIEQSSRAYPIWMDKRRAIDSNSRLYGWCVSEDLATNNNKSPKGLLFVKVYKCSSSTGAGVTLRIQDRLSKQLNRLNRTTAPFGTCFAHYAHASARSLRFQKRDPAQSFLWSIVREPAQRTLSHYFFFSVSRRNHTATEDSILAVLKSNDRPNFHNYPQHNFQSKYLDLPSSSQNEQSSSTSTERIINGYDFLGVSERMEESLVVLALLAQIPLTDVVVHSSKVAGSGSYGSAEVRGCVKLIKKWTTPKIEEYILGDYQKANKDDYLLYKAAQRSLDKTIDALGRKRVEKNVELLKSLQQQHEEQCASKVTMPCPQPKDESKKQEHNRLAAESCYKSDFGCGHACTDLVLADYAEKEWASITSSYYGQG